MGHQGLICRSCGAEWSVVEIEPASHGDGSLTCPACRGQAFGI